MKKCRKSAIILIAIMIVSAIVSFILLPKEIAVQRNINGIYSTASRWIVFLFPAAGVLTEYFCISNTEKNKRKKTDLIILVILLLAEGAIILNGFLDKI